MALKLNPGWPIVFKKVFIDGDHQIFASLINTILRDDKVLKLGEERDKVDEVKEFLDIFQNTICIEANARATDGRLLNIEVRITEQNFLEDKNLNYMQAIQVNQLLTVEKYQTSKNINKCIVIHLLKNLGNGKCTGHPHAVVRFQGNKVPEVSDKKVEIHFLEIQDIDLDVFGHTALNQWIKFFKCPETLSKEESLNNEVKQAMNKLTNLSYRPDGQELYNLYTKSNHVNPQ